MTGRKLEKQNTWLRVMKPMKGREIKEGIQASVVKKGLRK